MIVPEIIIMRFPLPGEKSLAAWAGQVRKVADDGQGGFVYGQPETHPPERLSADFGLELQHFVDAATTGALDRAALAEASIEVSQERATAASVEKNEAIAARDVAVKEGDIARAQNAQDAATIADLRAQVETLTKTVMDRNLSLNALREAMDANTQDAATAANEFAAALNIAMDKSDAEAARANAAETATATLQKRYTILFGMYKEAQAAVGPA